MRRIAVLGNGSIPRATIISNVEKYTSDIEGGFQFLIPLSEDQSKAALWVAEWAQVKDHAFNVWIGNTDLDERQDAVAQSSVRETTCDNPEQTIANSLNAESTLLIAWDESPEAEKFVLSALQRGVKVYDLADMTEMIDDEALATGEDPEDEEDDFDTGGDFPTVYVEEGVSERFEDTKSLNKKISRILDDANAKIARLIAEHLESRSTYAS